MCFVGRPHGVGEGVVPAAHDLEVRGLALRKPRGQGFDQRALGRCRSVGQGQRGLGGIVGRGEGVAAHVLVSQLPWKVVVRAGRIGDAPERHGAAGIGAERAAEAGDSLIVEIGEAPDEPAIEPELRLG
jgi:hypothetical protein